MVNIAIIGAGNIGSRHLQAMAHWQGRAKIQLVDPSPESLQRCRDRFFEVYKDDPKRIELAFHAGLKGLSGPIDVAIVSTTSSVRAQVIRELAGAKKVGSLILEKVLFQAPGDYAEIESLLKKRGIRAWVNCYMRAADFFKQLKKMINADEKILMSVDGSRWGMGTTSIHYLDLFSYLTGSKDFHFSDCRLEKTVSEAKRPGFKEFFGELKGDDGAGNSLSLTCRDTGSDPQTIHLENGSKKHEIKILPGGRISHRISVAGGAEELTENIPLALQSQTTHRLIEQIVNKGQCDLTPLQDSVRLHLPLIKVFLEYLSKMNNHRVEICPIT